MSQHTPGPWSINSDGEHGLITIYHRDMGHKQICDMCLVAMDGNHELDQEERANAYLIAAAPQLLAACKAALNELESVLEKTNAVLDLLANAISKAEGGR